jgi:hypothetical protein
MTYAVLVLTVRFFLFEEFGWCQAIWIGHWRWCFRQIRACFLFLCDDLTVVFGFWLKHEYDGGG